MSKPLELAFYNPGQLEEPDFLAGFVARQDLVKKILARLGEIKPKGLAQHRLILGQRGMGKTSLLRRIALGLRDDPALADVLLPLSFREEQYNVHNLHIFWCNCLDSLGDHFEATSQKDKAGQLDRDVAALNSREDDEEGSQALDLFKHWMKQEKRRPLLLLDNIDIIFAGLKAKQWSLRRVLQDAGGPVVIAASSAALEATADREGAFYDFFQVDVLAKLEHPEIVFCLRKMAERRGEAGRKVTETLDRDPARMHVLYDLTGGNPRTLSMLYLILETGGDESVMRDLERLLDQTTPLYKARVEDLAPQTRVVFDALALAWDPATAAQLAATTGLEGTTVSSQLERLVRDGAVEKTELSSTRRVGFQVAERFFNIWYLMRHGPRRQRQRLRWLTEMLRRIYSPRELRDWATGLLNRGVNSSDEYRLALSDALDDRELSVALRSSLRSESGCAEHPEDDSTKAKSVSVSGDEAALRKAIELNPKSGSPWNDLGRLLSKTPERLAEAEAAYRKAIELDPNYARPWKGLGALLSESPERLAEAEAAFRKAIELDSNFAWPWNNLGALLSESPERLAEAEAAYRKAIELDSNFAWPWNNLGWLLSKTPERLAEAEAAYRKAIELDSNFARPWNDLGWLLSKTPERLAEAEAAYRQAIALAPKFRSPWIGLGNLLADHLLRLEDARGAYQAALRIDPSDLSALNNLAYLTLRLGETGKEAEATYKNALAALPPHGAGLLRAFHALAFDNFGEATKELEVVLEENHPELFTTFRDDLLRVLAFAAERGLGDKLLAWFEARDLGDRFRPLTVAYEAYLYGKVRLLDVNPEVRAGAQRLLDEMPRRPLEPDQSAPEKPGRKARARKQLR